MKVGPIKVFFIPTSMSCVPNSLYDVCMSLYDIICTSPPHSISDLVAQSTGSIPIETQSETDEAVSEIDTGMYTLLNQSNKLYSPATSPPETIQKSVTEPDTAQERTASTTKQSKETQPAYTSDFGQCNT